MKQLLLIRHGAPHEGHARFPGDPPLDATGRRHASRLATRLIQERIDAVVSSPQRRALDTARPLARRLGLTPQVFDGLAEVDHGVARYRSVDTLKREDPAGFSEFMRSPARFFGIDPAAYRARVLADFERVLAEVPGERIAVFSHGMTIKTILCAALGVNDDAYARFLISHCSVSRLSGTALRHLRVDSVNESLCRPAPAPAPPKESP